jgi:hypothetical protein
MVESLTTAERYEDDIGCRLDSAFGIPNWGFVLSKFTCVLCKLEWFVVQFNVFRAHHSMLSVAPISKLEAACGKAIGTSIHPSAVAMFCLRIQKSKVSANITLGAWLLALGSEYILQEVRRFRSLSCTFPLFWVVNIRAACGQFSKPRNRKAM